MVLSDRKDPVWSISKLSNQVWWPDALTPDLCKPALSAGAPWGIEHPLDISIAPEIPTRGRNSKPGCSNSVQRTLLKRTEFYVCPGYHRGSSVHNKFGEKNRFFSVPPGAVKPLEMHIESPPPHGIIS